MQNIFLIEVPFHLHPASDTAYALTSILAGTARQGYEKA